MHRAASHSLASCSYAAGTVVQHGARNVARQAMWQRPAQRPSRPARLAVQARQADAGDNDWESWADAPNTPVIGVSTSSSSSSKSSSNGSKSSSNGNGTSGSRHSSFQVLDTDASNHASQAASAGEGGSSAAQAGGSAGTAGSPAPLQTHTSQDWASSDEEPLAGALAGAGATSLSDWEQELLSSWEQQQRANQRGAGWASGSGEDEDWALDQPERCFLVGVQLKQQRSRYGYDVEESLGELRRLADTAGLEVVGQTYQLLEEVNPRTFVGSGKVQEIRSAVMASGAETVIFDDELSPGQLRNLERALGDNVRLCDRTALILDIFSQRAATREGKLQVELAQTEYQLPRLTRMWSHLERQSGSGQVKGMGEKQIEVDRRLLKSRIARLKRELDEVRTHRRAYRERRAKAPIPVVALVGYTNAGKSTLLNTLTGAGVLAEDKLFATLDPTTRRVELRNGQEVLVSDTVGFIQKLPTQLVAAFRATLEEIAEASLLLHVVDVSHPNAPAQIDSVNAVLRELGVQNLPVLNVWNKVDACGDPAMLRAVASGRENTVCISGLTGEGMEALLDAISGKLQHSMVSVHVLIPYSQGELVDEMHRTGVVESADFTEAGTEVRGHVPPALAMRLLPLRILAGEQQAAARGG